MNENQNLNQLYKNVNDILKRMNVSEIDPNKQEYQGLQTGYYLCSFKVEITTSKAGNLQAKAEMTIVEDGIAINEDGDFEEIKNSAKRKLWKYYPLTDEDKVKNFIKDMKKFEDEDGSPILTNDDFNSIESIQLACEVIEDLQLFVYVNNYKNKNGEDSSFYNVISFKRAEELGLLGDEN